MVDEDRIAFDRARDVGAHALRVRIHLPDFLDDVLGRVGQIDRVAVALAHLAVVEAGQARRRREQRLRLDEQLAVEIVEPPHDFARQLEVRHLILAHRHEVRVIDDDVGGLQQRVPEKSEVRQIAVRHLLDLFLVSRDALEPRDRRHHLQQQVQLRVLRHERLHEQRALLRIDARADPVRDVVERVFDDRRRVRVIAGERVPVGDEVETVVLPLQLLPVLQRAHQVSQVQAARRAHARHHAFPSCHRHSVARNL